MDNVYKISLLLDFYGQLLTDRQYEILDLHYNNDYTLTEIAEQLSISRQAVFDNEKRGTALLNGYESKLGLLNKFSQQKQKAERVQLLLAKLELGQFSRQNKDIINEVVHEIDELVNSI